MCLNHAKTIPTQVHGKIVFHKTSPWCQKDWGLLHQRSALTVITKEEGDNLSSGVKVAMTTRLLLAKGLGEKPFMSGSKAGKEEVQWELPAHIFPNIHLCAILGLCALKCFPGNMNPRYWLGPFYSPDNLFSILKSAACPALRHLIHLHPWQTSVSLSHSTFQYR